MAIGLRASGSTTWDVNASSQVINKPAAAVTGDVCVIAIGLNMSSPSTTLTGWNLAGSISLASASTVVFWRAVLTADTSWTYTPGGGAQQFGGAFQTFTGVDTTTANDVTAATQTSASGTTITAPAVTIITDQAWHLIGVGTFNGGGTATNFTALNNGGSPSNEGACLLYNQTPKSTGSTGTVTVTTVSGAKSVVVFALRPAAGTPISPLPTRRPTFVGQSVNRASTY